MKLRKEYDSNGTEELRKKPREVKLAKFFRDGNLLMCTKQKSRETKQSRWKVSARRWAVKEGF